MSPSLRILLLRSHAGYYGVERLVVELARGLQDLGHLPCVGIIGRAEETDKNFMDACRQQNLQYRLFNSKSATDRSTVSAIQAWIKEFKPHVIHTHGYKADFVGWLANRKSSTALMATCHPWLGTSDSVRMWLYKQLDQVVLTRFEKVVAISENVKADCTLRTIRRNDIQVIANGLDLDVNGYSRETGRYRKKWGIGPDAFVLGVIGRLSHEKGQRHLLPAFAELCRNTQRPLTLLLAGDGPDRALLEKVARDLDLNGQIKFLGFQQEIPALLACLDLFVMPSLSEGLPLALLEAMAAGRTILATDVGEIQQVLDHGRAGMVVEPGDSTKLYQGLVSLMEQPGRCQEMARNAQERAKSHYSRRNMTTQYEKIYRALSKAEELQTHVS
jgi:glycosyltransferase involved in cell wall biosynthesis